MQLDYEDIARYALNKIKQAGYEIYLIDPAKTVSQPEDQLVYFLARFTEERAEEIVNGWWNNG